MLRRVPIIGLLVAAVAVPALAADFIIHGNLNVGDPSANTRRNLTVNGQIVFPNAVNGSSPLVVVPPLPSNAVPECDMSTLGQIGTGLFPLMSRGEYDAVLWFCGRVEAAGKPDTPQLYVLDMQWWPTTGSGQGAASSGSAPSDSAGAGADTAALAARAAALEKELAALQAIACRDRASEEACR